MISGPGSGHLQSCLFVYFKPFPNIKKKKNFSPHWSLTCRQQQQQTELDVVSARDGLAGYNHSQVSVLSSLKKTVIISLRNVPQCQLECMCIFK